MLVLSEYDVVRKRHKIIWQTPVHAAIQPRLIYGLINLALYQVRHDVNELAAQVAIIDGCYQAGNLLEIVVIGLILSARGKRNPPRPPCQVGDDGGVGFDCGTDGASI